MLYTDQQISILLKRFSLFLKDKQLAQTAKTGMVILAGNPGVFFHEKKSKIELAHQKRAFEAGLIAYKWFKEKGFNDWQ